MRNIVNDEGDRPQQAAAGERRRPSRRWLIGVGVLAAAGRGAGIWRFAASGRQPPGDGDGSEQQQDFVPNVRVAAVRPSDSIMIVSLPATTLAFEAANIFRARQRLHRKASGRYRRSRQGGRAAGADHRSRTRSSDRTESGDAASGRRRRCAGEASRELASVTNERDSDLVEKRMGHRPAGRHGPSYPRVHRMPRLRRRIQYRRAAGAAPRARPAEVLSERGGAVRRRSSPSAPSIPGAWCRRGPPSCSP